MTAYEVSLALVSMRGPFPFRRYLVVPNLSWGLLSWEADIAAMAPSGYLYEAEIKISHADLKADFDKPKHKHFGGQGWALIRGFWFAMPENLYALALKAQTPIPEYAGIVVVAENEKRRYCRIVRNCAINKQARKLSASEQHTLGRLGTMRYWSRREARAEEAILDRAEKGSVG